MYNAFNIITPNYRFPDERRKEFKVHVSKYREIGPRHFSSCAEVIQVCFTDIICYVNLCIKDSSDELVVAEQEYDELCSQLLSSTKPVKSKGKKQKECQKLQDDGR